MAGELRIGAEGCDGMPNEEIAVVAALVADPIAAGHLRTEHARHEQRRHDQSGRDAADQIKFD